MATTATAPPACCRFDRLENLQTPLRPFGVPDWLEIRTVALGGYGMPLSHAATMRRLLLLHVEGLQKKRLFESARSNVVTGVCGRAVGLWKRLRPDLRSTTESE
jgi:hypothetical protein